LVKQQGAWRLIRPVDAAADQAIVEGLVAALRLGKRLRAVTQQTDQLDAFGLIPPSLQINMRVQPGNIKKQLLIGSKSPVGPLVYSKWHDESAVFLLDERFQRSFQKTAYALRDKRLLAVNVGELRRVTVTFDKDGLTLAEQDGTWQLTAPEEQAVDQGKVTSYLKQLGLMYVKEFLDQADPEAKIFGLTTSKHVVELQDHSGVATTLRIGKKDEAKDAYYVSVNQRPPVLLVKPSVVDELKVSYYTFLPTPNEESNQS